MINSCAGLSSVWSNISSIPRANTSVRPYVAHAVAWGWDPEWTAVWHFIMHAAVIHLRLSVTPSATVAQVVLQHNLSTSVYYLRRDAVQCFAPGYRRSCIQVQDYNFLRVQHRRYSSMLGQSPSTLMMKSGCFFQTSVSTKLNGIKTYKTTIWQIHAWKYEKWPITHLPLKTDCLETGSLD